MNKLNIKMPIKLIDDKKKKYLFGTRIRTANLDSSKASRTVMVRVGGGYREFEEYLKAEE